MTTSLKMLFIILFTGIIGSLSGQTADNDSVKYEILMDGKLLSDMKITGTLTGSFEMTSNKYILFSTTDQFYLLGWGGIVPLGKKTLAAMGSFAFTPDSILMCVRNNQLCNLDSLGNLSQMYQLPGNNMGISAGKNVMYLYERDLTKEKNALYMIARGGSYLKLIEVPGPVNALAEYGNSLYFSTQNAVLQYNLTTKELKAVAVLPDQGTIQSLTVNPSDGSVYFSTSQSVFTIRNNSIIILSDKLGGFLRYYGGLIVYSPQNKLMIRMAGLNERIFASAVPVKKEPEPAVAKTARIPNQPADTLTNEKVIRLVGSKLADKLIITIIEHAKVNFDLGVNAMIELAAQQVSSDVILAMRQAMQR
jgi:hypothetical protein